MKTPPTTLPTGSQACQCPRVRHKPRLVVLTGGPGGGKTAVLEMARRYFCHHVSIMPEAASIVFGGGFPRSDSPHDRRAAQTAIFHVQRSLEAVALANHQTAVVLCDRGTLDGLAYWPGPHRSFFKQFGIDRDKELARYSAVVHVEVPALSWGYEQNRIRNESAGQSHLIDQRIVRAWHGHQRILTVGAKAGFLDKLAYAIELLRAELPACCETHLHALTTAESLS